MTPAGPERSTRIRPERSSPPRALALIPARLASLRLPRKMLLDETGLPLFVHTARNVARARTLARVVVATDAEEIAAAARAHGVEAVMTRPEHPSGTDRIHEALLSLQAGDGDFDVVLNVQGDEPELEPEVLDRLAAAFADPAVELATLAGPLRSGAEADAPQVVKVVCDRRGDALYFSRSQVPHRPMVSGDSGDSGASGDTGGAARPRSYARAGAPPWEAVARRHVGVYAFRPAALAEFCALPPGPLERLENLEQLRWLEAGRRIRVLDTDHVPLGIDTRADYDAFVRRVRAGAASGR